MKLAIKPISLLLLLLYFFTLQVHSQDFYLTGPELTALKKLLKDQRILVLKLKKSITDTELQLKKSEDLLTIFKKNQKISEENINQYIEKINKLSSSLEQKKRELEIAQKKIKELLSRLKKITEKQERLSNKLKAENTINNIFIGIASFFIGFLTFYLTKKIF